MSQEFFYAKYHNDRIETRGVNFKFLGHKIERRAGENPDGIFVEWSWDGNVLRVRNDRYGFYPLFYCCNDTEIYISTSIECLIKEGVPKDLDFRALSVFLRIGFFVSDDSPFKHIKILPPNSNFTWSRGQLKLSGEYCCAKEHTKLSYDDAIEKYIFLFSQSIRRRLPSGEGFVAPISAGRDSRHILFELNTLGCNPKFCLTIKRYPPGENDVPIGRLISKRLGLEHVALDPPRSYFRNEITKNLKTSFCSDELQEGVAIVDYLVDKTKIYFDGIGGDILSSPFMYNLRTVSLYENRSFDELAMEIIRGQEGGCFADNVFRNVVSPEWYKKMSLECAVNHLKGELKKHAHTPNPIKQFYFWNRTRREIALGAYALYDAIPVVYSPYLDYDLYDFLSSINARNCIFDRDFHTDTIKRAYPQYADIPYEKRANTSGLFALRKRYVLDLLISLIKERRAINESIRMQYVLSRLIRYICRGDNWWIAPRLIHYLIELEKFSGSGSN